MLYAQDAHANVSIKDKETGEIVDSYRSTIRDFAGTEKEARARIRKSALNRAKDECGYEANEVSVSIRNFRIGIYDMSH